MKIGVVGTGYVGLVTGTCLSELGHRVTCIDQDSGKIAKLQDGESPIFEPGLTELIKKNLKSSMIQFSTDPRELKECQAIFLAVGTPATASGEANLDYLFQAARDIAPYIQPTCLMIIKSTVPVGTSAQLKSLLYSTHFKGVVVSNPEFLKEGHAVDDFMKPDRVVVGLPNTPNDVLSQIAKQTMDEIYGPLVLKGRTIVYMSNESAELTKYASNCFLATKISFINEMAKLCDLLGADIDEVRQGMILDSRIGPHFLYPGIGYGGSCFPKDVQALVHLAKKKGSPQKIIQMAHEVNNEQILYFYEKIRSIYPSSQGNTHSPVTFALWGTAFKPQTDDVREAPSIKLAQLLLHDGFKLQIFDPIAMDNFKRELNYPSKNQVFYCKSKEDAIQNANALILVTEWPEFRAPDLKALASTLIDKTIFDGRNIYPQKEMAKYHLRYIAIGKSSNIHAK